MAFFPPEKRMGQKNFRDTLRNILNTRMPYRRHCSYHQRDSAVLVPIFKRNNEYFLIFTKRAPSVKYHQGHVSFPGGVVARHDRDFVQTALRETEEEIGILKEDVDILGPLDDSLTYVPPFVIHPYVGTVPYPYSFTMNPDEVEKIIEVPLSHLTPHADSTDDWSEVDHDRDPRFPDFYYGGETIWGTTASITANFLGILKNNRVV
jgi:8-oxo-dGTP pyrophosphatase MutT (NUDIX family)